MNFGVFSNVFDGTRFHTVSYGFSHLIGNRNNTFKLFPSAIFTAVPPGGFCNRSEGVHPFQDMSSIQALQPKPCTTQQDVTEYVSVHRGLHVLGDVMATAATGRRF